MRKLSKLVVTPLAVIGALEVLKSYQDSKAKKALDAKVDAATNTHKITSL
jgi:hypothetical protein